jgi:putative ABC transport system permease protein
MFTTATITVATVLYAVLISVPSSIDRVVDQFSEGLRLVVDNKNGPYGVPAQYCEDIRRLPLVTGCAPLNFVYFSCGNSQRAVATFAVDPEFARISIDTRIAEALLREFFTTRRGALAGKRLIEKYHWKVGQQIVLDSLDATFQVSVVLIGELPADRMQDNVVIRRDYLVDSIRSSGYKGEIRPLLLSVGVHRSEDVGTVIKEIDENFTNSESETLTQTESESIANTLSFFGNVRGIIQVLCSIVLVTVLLIAANSMAMSMRERLGDVAVLRALGFGRGRVGWLLLGESTLVALIGGLTGSTAALWFFANGMDFAPVPIIVGTVSVTPSVALQAFGAAIAVGVLSAIVPAFKAMRMSPAMGIRPIV